MIQLRHAFQLGLGLAVVNMTALWCGSALGLWQVELPGALAGTERFPGSAAASVGLMLGVAVLPASIWYAMRALRSGAAAVNCDAARREAALQQALEIKTGRQRKMLAALRDARAKIQDQQWELEHAADIDSLTGCLNRRAFFEQLELLLSAAARYRHPLGCIMVNVDQLRSLNGQHGHALGDRVLKTVAAALRDATRDPDLVCRFGGAQFCLVLSYTDLPGAKQAAQRIQEQIAATATDGLRVTASIGVSALSLGAPTSEALVEHVDLAAEAASRAGGNRVVCFDAMDRVDEPDEATPPAEAGSAGMPA